MAALLSTCTVYYYLIIVLQESVYFLEEVPIQPDPNVMLLNDALSSIKDAIGNYVPTQKIEYVYEFERMHISMSTCVSAPVSFSRLLNLSPIEIVDRETIDNNPQFTLDEFIHLFIHHSSPATEAATINEQHAYLHCRLDVSRRISI
eukprot:CFRG6730T1